VARCHAGRALLRRLQPSWRNVGRPPRRAVHDTEVGQCQAMVPSLSDTTLLATPALISDCAPMMLRVRPPQLTMTVVADDGMRSAKR
jgi:hypothetical protein